MSNVNNVNVPATGPIDSRRDGAVDAYTRAVTARPTGFAENPLGAMANAMDRIGRAAGNLISGGEHTTSASMAEAEQRVMRANDTARANPHSLQAKQGQLTESLKLLKEMQNSGVAANDPRRVKLAGFIVQLANTLGPAGLPQNIPGLDVMGMLKLAATVTSRFGDGAGMHAAFGLEQMLKSVLGGSSVASMQALDKLMEKFGIGNTAAQLIKNGWKVVLVQDGGIPSVDTNSRQISIDASKENASLGVLARAYWNDVTISNPADKDGFMKAFLKIAQQGHMPVLSRKYKELRRMARHQMMSAPTLTSVGNIDGSSIMSVNRKPKQDDESGDMFAALAVFSHGPDGTDIPDSLKPALSGFFGQRAISA